MALVINGRCFTRPIGGVERHARMLIRLIARTYPDARVVVPADAPEDLDLPHGLAVERTGRMHGHTWEQLSLPRAMGPNDVLLSPANTGPLRVRRQAVVVHDLAFLHHPECFDARFAKWYGFLVPRLVRRAAVVITVSPTMRDELVATFALPKDTVVVVSPYVDPSQFARSSPVQVPAGFFLVVGHDDPRKDVRHALDLLFQVLPDAHAVVVGRTRRPFRGQGPIPDPRTTWLPDASDAQLTWLYDHARALLYPSRYEGFGLPVLEALQRGCPVVTRPLPVLKDHFGDTIHMCSFTGTTDLSALLNGLPSRRSIPVAPYPGAQRVLSTFSEGHTDHALLNALTLLTNT